ncbi:MAG: transposase [Pseudomonadota bacterium]
MNVSVNADERSARLSVVQQKVKRMSGRKVSVEEKSEAVRRVLEVRERVADVALDLGVSESAVHNWVSGHKKDLERELMYKGVIDRCSHLEDALKERDERIAYLDIKVGVLEDMLDKFLKN